MRGKLPFQDPTGLPLSHYNLIALIDFLDLGGLEAGRIELATRYLLCFDDWLSLIATFFLGIFVGIASCLSWEITAPECRHSRHSYLEIRLSLKQIRMRSQYL